MNNLFRIVLIFLLFSFFLFKASPVLAQESISSFNSKMTIHNNGTIDVTETIVYNFGSEYRHGIFRNIPLVSKVGNLYKTIRINLKEVLVDETLGNYSDNSSNSKFSIKIGDANKTITGEHVYIISYLVENNIVTYSDHDENYWNVTGNDWKVPIYKAITVIDTDSGFSPDNYICFTGTLGSKNKDCAIDSASSSIQTTKELLPGEGLSIAISFPPKTFPQGILTQKSAGLNGESMDPKTLLVIIISIVGWLILVNIITPLILVIWYFTKKDKKRFGPVTVNFDIPKDKNKRRILPAEAGTIDTAMLDRDDVVGTIFDLAIRKFIKLEEIEKKKFLGLGNSKSVRIKKLKSYSLKEIPKPPKGISHFMAAQVRDDNFYVSPFENILLDRLFEDGDEVNLEDLRSDFYKTFSEMGDAVFKDHVKNGFYTKNPKNQRTLLTVLSVLSFIIGGYILGIVLLVLSRKLNGRTALGDELDFRIDGLKLFLKSMDRNYKWQAEQLYIVEQMIPYAIALGYIDKFMKQLKIIKPDYNPTWYSGSSSFYLMSPLIFSSMNSNFASSAPSSSSGFSGGGFSGGGGGGGGGGSW